MPKEKNDLIDSLASAKKKDSGGSHGNAGFSFQKNWGILKLLELHKSQDDYVVVFDYHEDTIVLDSPENSTKVEFYQIKQKESGNWTNTLLTKKNKPSGSILAKLISPEKEIFDEDENYYYFISNASFSFELNEVDEKGKNIKSTNRIEVTFPVMSEKEFKSIQSKIQEEVNIDLEDIKSKVIFQKVLLPVETGDSHCIGEIQRFLRENYQGDFSFRPDDFYMTIFSIIETKTNFKYEVKTKELLLKEKSITKEDFKNFLARSNAVVSPMRKWNRIDGRLVADNISGLVIRNFKKEWELFYFDKLNRVQLTMQVIEAVQEIIDGFGADEENLTTMELVDTVLQAYNANKLEEIYSEDRIRVITLDELC